jgi:hypothetical protein
MAPLKHRTTGFELRAALGRSAFQAGAGHGGFLSSKTWGFLSRNGNENCRKPTMIYH